MNEYKLSIVIPVYNQEELAKRAIKSVPIRDDVELIVVNDGSTDNTAKSVLEVLEERNSENDTFVDCVKNEGVASALNTGIEHMTGEYYLALGSDDYFLTDALNEFIDTQLDGTDMIYFNLEINDGSLIEPKEETRGVWVGSTKVYKATLIGEDRYPDGKRAHEDLVLDVKLRNKKHTHKFSGMTIKHYNFPREGSLTYQVNHKQIDSQFIGK